MEELEHALGTLTLGKAEGLDGITNEMLQNTGPTAREMLLDLFNNVLTGGSLPSDWKIGDIVLILKKPPRTDINNYRPVTLISSVSKLLTTMLAQRLSSALDKEDVVGQVQNGFRKNRSCSDNIFILNTILEANKNKRLLSPQFQKRGLRQGCNLSAVLFILYLSELSRRMRESGIGPRLPSGELVNILLFADDIIILGTSTSDLDKLKSILENWCKDFKMMILTLKPRLSHHPRT